MIKRIIFTILIAAIVVGIVFVVGVYFFGDTSTEKTSEEPAIVEEKVRLLPEAFENDTDRDGVSNEDEQARGTSDRDFDTDGDGISDALEIEKYKTDPTNPDSDGDGFWDGIEILSGFNPNGQGPLTTDGAQDPQQPEQPTKALQFQAGVLQ